jgi:hypothetical protein
MCPWELYVQSQDAELMRDNCKKQDIVFIKGISEDPMGQEEWDAAEDLLARLIARAIATEHPEWSGEDE